MDSDPGYPTYKRALELSLLLKRLLHTAWGEEKRILSLNLKEVQERVDALYTPERMRRYALEARTIG